MPKDIVTQSEFDKCVDEWKNMDRTTEDAQNAALTFYDEDVFPLVKKVFLSNRKNRPNKQYDALILPLGFSPEPLILSILALKPQQVGLIYTKQTKSLLDRIQKETRLTLDKIKLHEIDGSNTLEVYQTIMTFYNEWGRPANIAVDITGGKKSMVGGAAMAGAALGADIYYVDNTKFTKFGKPEPGTEYLSLLDNPYTVFGDLEVENAKSLYEVHDYAGTKRIFYRLRDVGDPAQSAVHQAYGYLCTAYEAWDNLDTGTAVYSIERLLEILAQYPRLDGLRHLGDNQNCLEQQKEALTCLKTFIKKSQLALKYPNGFHFAFTLYHNALRREAQGKLDMACLILYRLLEWIEQYRLNEHGIDTKTPNYSKCKMDRDLLLSSYNKKRKEVYPKNADGSETADMPDLPNRIALVDGFLILAALGDSIVEDLNWGRFRNDVDTRNQSIFAHGMKKIEEKDYKNFKSTVTERFKKAQEIACIDADAFNEQHKFIAPLP